MMRLEKKIEEEEARRVKQGRNEIATAKDDGRHSRVAGSNRVSSRNHVHVVDPDGKSRENFTMRRAERAREEKQQRRYKRNERNGKEAQ